MYPLAVNSLRIRNSRNIDVEGGGGIRGGGVAKRISGYEGDGMGGGGKGAKVLQTYIQSL